LKKLFENKIYLGLIVAYMVTQFFWPISELLFLLSLIVAVYWISKNYNSSKNFKPITTSILICFAANLILTLIYVPMLILNPEVNWTLQDGRQESDPMILLAYFPTVNFAFFCVVVLIAGLTIKVSELQRLDHT
jgi:hypothetical protein